MDTTTSPSSVTDIEIPEPPTITQLFLGYLVLGLTGFGG